MLIRPSGPHTHGLKAESTRDWLEPSEQQAGKTLTRSWGFTEATKASSCGGDVRGSRSVTSRWWIEEQRLTSSLEGSALEVADLIKVSPYTILCAIQRVVFFMLM